MTDTLHRVGRMDPNQPDDLRRTLGQFEQLMEFCVQHVHHENDFVHAAIEARQPRGAARTADDHLEHIAHIAALRDEARALAQAEPTARPTLALRLYRHLALFVAENFEHMHFEETAHNEALWAGYDDAAIAALEQRIVAQATPQQRAMVLRWMTPALPPHERAERFRILKASLPPVAFTAMLDIAREVLDDRDWAKLSEALANPQEEPA